MGEVLVGRVPAPLREDPGLSIFGCAKCGSPLGVFRADPEAGELTRKCPVCDEWHEVAALRWDSGRSDRDEPTHLKAA